MEYYGYNNGGAKMINDKMLCLKVSNEKQLSCPSEINLDHLLDVINISVHTIKL
jgi:hypothetical protein